MEATLYYIGQALGIVAVILGFISYQMKLPRGIILTQLATAMVFAAHYLLIGAVTAAVLNFLAGLKCIAYYFRDKRGSRSLVEPIVFIVLVIVSGILTWESWYSIALMLGLVVDTVGLAMPDAQMTRRFVFVKSPLCLLYNAMVFSVGGIIYECAVLISSVIGLMKYRKVDASR